MKERVKYRLKYLKEKDIITKEESNVILETFRGKRIFK